MLKRAAEVTRKASGGGPSGVIFRAATATRWKDIERLFGERGACGGCWCMAWRLPRKEWEAGKGAGNQKRLRVLVEKNGRPGIIAYHGREPVGWCAIAPRRDYPALARSRVLKPVDDSPVWSVSCLFVLRAWRRRGLSAKLLKAAATHAAGRGARIVEGYPVIPHSSEAPGAFLWTGTPGAFEKAGFREVHRWSKARPIMRLEVGRRTPASRRS